MSDISEHDTDEEAKSDDIERSRVYFCVGRYTISVDNLLRHFKHAICIKFARRHFVGVYYVESQGRKVAVGLDDQR